MMFGFLIFFVLLYCISCIAYWLLKDYCYYRNFPFYNAIKFVDDYSSAINFAALTVFNFLVSFIDYDDIRIKYFLIILNVLMFMLFLFDLIYKSPKHDEIIYKLSKTAFDKVFFNSLFDFEDKFEFNKELILDQTHKVSLVENNEKIALKISKNLYIVPINDMSKSKLKFCYKQIDLDQINKINDIELYVLKNDDDLLYDNIKKPRNFKLYYIFKKFPFDKIKIPLYIFSFIVSVIILFVLLFFMNKGI